MQTTVSLWQRLKNIVVNYWVIDTLLKNYDPYHNEYMAKPPTSVKEDSKMATEPENMPNNISQIVHELSKLEHKNWVGFNISKWDVWGNSKNLVNWILQGKAVLHCHIRLCPCCLQWFVFQFFGWWCLNRLQSTQQKSALLHYMSAV